MTNDDWKTLRVPAEAYDAAKAQKDENNRTWGEQLTCGNTTTTEVVDCDEFVESLLSEIHSKTLINVEDARLIGQNLDRTVAPYAEDIENRIDDLESSLPRTISEELQR